MQNVPYILGIDLSKKTLDVYAYQSKKHFCVDNQLSGFKELIAFLKREGIALNQVIIVMEHTGLYSYCLEKFLHQQGIAFSKVSALMIKRSLGIVRGKSDRIDAKRIAMYGQQKISALLLEKPANEVLERLQFYYQTRNRMVKNRASFLNAMKEYQNIGLKEKDPLMQSQLRVVRQLDKEIERMEAGIDELLQSDEALQKNYKLLISVRGVGRIVAVATLISTRNFSRFTNARKFACFCGVAPFENTSGSSIRGKTRVSHLADKSLKTLFDLAAKAAIQHDPEIKNYYQMRVEKGKSKMSTINVVRNKIIYRMFAVIKRQSPFVDQFLQVA
jgi:transposase